MGLLDRFRLDRAAALLIGAGVGQAGADVAIVARSPGPLAAIEADIEAMGRRCVAISMDVTKAPS